MNTLYLSRQSTHVWRANAAGFWIAFWTCVLALASPSASAESMHALVIGNASYPNGALANPANDARLMGSTLESLGFQVTTLIDQTQQQMDQEIAGFCHRVPKNGLALFFFAGHGLQINGENYLVPIDAKLHDETAVKYKTVSQNYVVDSLYSSASNMNVVVLDCCRDNPFQRAWNRSSANRGLAPAQVIPEGTLIAYATSPGDTALDGSGANSPYTTELAKAFSQRPSTGLLLRDVFFTASAAVRKATGQRPWLNLDASLDAFYLRPPEVDVDRVELNQVAMKIESGSLQSANTSDLEIPAPVLGDLPNPTSEATSPDTLLLDSSLMRQADTFLNEGDYDLAIEAYTVLINDSSLSKEQQLKVRRNRGVAYLTRRQDRDIERAILDYQACGEEGVHMSILMDSVSLKVGNESKATARKNQIALVTLSQGDWLWIESIHDNNSIQGWVSKDAFRKPSSETASSPIASAQTVQSAAQPASGVSRPTSSVVSNSGSFSPSQSTSSSLTQPSSSQPTSSVPSNGFASSQSQFSQQPQRFSQQPAPVQSQFRSATPQTSNQFSSNNGFQQSNQSNQRNQFSNSGNSRSNVPSGASPFTQKFMQKNNRPPSIWQTPQWESPAQIKRLRAQGLVR
ncbi:caspase family protein [Neorhodopirellula pilleata]|uniref:Caspase domain protein n=1 Tax=Neorhodopirellula pilleata TaxID=2714738 RepID=A0A5C6AA98_9BACT|nr:caspase family protein [Neorhodopirellula pilleata]TWT96366.1 Caspase domain protein [Neorhodopirellula pilleata]